MSIDGDLKDVKYSAHNLKGDYSGYREAYLENDLLIVWEKNKNNITLIIIGTHYELFT